MTTTLRPTGPLQTAADGTRSRAYDVCVNSRPVGVVRLATDPGFGREAGVIESLRIDEADRRRGRGTVAALAAEEVLRGWGCTQVHVSVPPEAGIAQRMVEAFGYTERSRNMVKDLAGPPPALPDGIETRPMTREEFVVWEAAGRQSYAESWIARGVPEDQAHAKAEASHRDLLPEGLDSPGVSIEVVLRDGALVGHVWTARRELEPGVSGWYVYDVLVDAEQRGHGYGRALMLLAERVAADAGASLLGLHVFAGNTPALALYESLGYRTTHVNSYKTLL
ncbi:MULTISPECIES: GNAT family N-acetyltransferase [Streptomyces]|uniref:GNAT family N-acetyltransferase n=1 Tax=Streptomyces solicathayae TaxID=3081768 RepID=A0ABZ0M1A7_9ACTN|nr:GNAT family N-acetyltransferase [Streptomyces sp. HUAS YS2]WOX25456.1 GNAT family N-acetyltransferase [Streptomyces sp. HUAS YS2]